MRTSSPLFNRFSGKTRLCFEALREQRIIQGNEVFAKALCKAQELRYYRAGEVIINQNDGTNHIVFILAGKVTVRCNNREIAERTAGECVGEMSLIDVAKPRCASIVAKEECVLAAVSESKFTKIAGKFPDLWRHLAKQMADRLRQRMEGIRPQNEIPHIFIGSSRESLQAAEAVKAALQSLGVITVWNKGVFGPDKFTLEALEEQSQKADFAIMVFGPDDVIFSRGRRFEGPRDNVIFELGIFMGQLGRKRAFVVSPRGKPLKIPSDLLGTNSVQYQISKGEPITRSIDIACDDLRKIIKTKGPI